MLKATAGLRERQKQQRREMILDTAKRLFEDNGIEEVSMAAIAAETGVSTPTVFNYFGSRDELLLAIILDGHNMALTANRSRNRRTDASLSVDLCDLLSNFTARSLKIFNKTVWRYADSAVIRQPDSDFVRQYSQIDSVLTRTIENLLTERPCRTRRGDVFSASALAAVIYSHWVSHYTAYIKDDGMTLNAHLDAMLPQIRELVDLIFEDS